MNRIYPEDDVMLKRLIRPRNELIQRSFGAKIHHKQAKKQ